MQLIAWHNGNEMRIVIFVDSQRGATVHYRYNHLSSGMHLILELVGKNLDLCIYSNIFKKIRKYSNN